MSYLKQIQTAYYDSGNLDAFGRLKVASPQTLFDAQFTYDLQPLVFEKVAPATTSITHDTTNRRAFFQMTNTAPSTEVFMQSYDFFRYQPGKGQEINVTFTLGSAVANVVKYAGYSDGNNGVVFGQDGTNGLFFQILSATGSGSQLELQSNWNVDKLDGTGKSGETLDITKAQILYIDLQALYTGRVRCGFSINGRVIIAHEFLNANVISTPYIQTANLPIRVGMYNSGVSNVSASMYFTCSMVASSGGIDEAVGYEFTTPDTVVTAGNGTRTHVMSIRPKTTFNSITNRSKVASLEIDIIVTGNSPVYWELCLGQAFSVAPTYADINSTYSAFERGTGGTLTGSPALVIDSGYISATASTKGTANMNLTDRYPITLNAAGAVRSIGTLTLLVTGIGASSACRSVLKHKEIR